MLLTRAINNGLEIVPSHSAEAAALRAEMQDVSSRVGFDKLGTAATLLWEFDAAYSAPVTFRCCGGSPPRVAVVDEDGAERRGSPRRRSAYALEEGRLADAAETHAGFVAGCPTATAASTTCASTSRSPPGAATGRRGLALYEELLTMPMLYDAASTINSVFVLVEDLLGLGRRPAEVRSRVFDGWLAEHPSNATFRPTPMGCWRWPRASTSGPRRRCRRCSWSPDPCLAKPVIGSLRTALAEALLGAGDRAGALVAIRRAIDDDLARWPGVRRDRAEALARRLQGASSRARRRAHGAGARGRRAGRRRAHQRPARRAAVHLAEDGGRPRRPTSWPSSACRAAPRSPPGPSATGRPRDRADPSVRTARPARASPQQALG